MSLLLALLAALGWLLLGLLSLVVLVCALPFKVEARGAVDSEQEGLLLPFFAWGAVRGCWAWGGLSLLWSTDQGGELRLLGLRLFRFGGERLDPAEKRRRKREKREQQQREKVERQKKKQAKVSKARAKGKRARRYSPSWGLQHRRTLQRLAGRFWRALKIRLTVTGALGLGDPADTVVVAETLRWAHSALPGTTLDVEIDYLDELLVLRGALSGRVWLPQLAGIALTELPRRDVRQMLAGR